LIEKGGLGEEFIETIRSFKKELDPILSELGLPRLVRVLVSDILTLDSGAYGIYVHSDAEPYFNIQIDIEQLREFELS